MRRIEICENGIFLVIDIENDRARISRLSALPPDESLPSAARSLPFAGFRDELDQTGRLVTLIRRDEASGAEVRDVFRFFGSISAVGVSRSGAAPQRSIPSVSAETVCSRGGSACHIRQDDPDGSFLLAVGDSFNAALGELTRLRRAMRRRTRDCRDLPVIFDGSGCTGDIRPLAEAAASCKCNYFRFGIKDGVLPPADTAKFIRSLGMTPALSVASFSDEDAEALMRECGTGHIFAADGTDYDRIDELLAKRKDLAPASETAASAASARGMLLRTDGDAAKGFMMAAPEQLLVRCRLSEKDTREQSAAALTGGMLARAELCGQPAKESIPAVREGIAVYKHIRADIRDGLPFVSVCGEREFAGILSADGRRAYIALRGNGGDRFALGSPLGGEISARCIYPSFFGGEVSVGRENISVTLGSRDKAALIMLESAEQRQKNRDISEKH